MLSRTETAVLEFEDDPTMSDRSMAITIGSVRLRDYVHEQLQ